MILIYLCITRPFPYFRFRRSSPVSFADTLPPGEGFWCQPYLKHAAKPEFDRFCVFGA